MLKHRGFPGRLTGTDFQFTIRRANKKDGPAKLIARERYKDRKHVDRLADQAGIWQVAQASLARIFALFDLAPQTSRPLASLALPDPDDASVCRRAAFGDV